MARGTKLASGNAGRSRGPTVRRLKDPEKIWLALSPRVRQALANANYNYGLNGIRPMIKKYGEDAFIKILMAGDDKRTAETCMALYGPSHPQAR